MKSCILFGLLFSLLCILASCAAGPEGSSSAGGGAGNSSVNSSAISGGNSSAQSSSAGSSSSGSSSSAAGLPAGIYVSPGGFDSNPGTNSSAPMLTLQKAYDKAVSLGFTNIYVAQGLYQPSAGMDPLYSVGLLITNDNISILGGFSNNFSNRNGMSELKGANALYHLSLMLAISNARYAYIDGFVIENFTNSSYSQYAGGIEFRNSSYCTVTNTVISNNQGGFGGGITFVTNSSFNSISALVIKNHANALGGGGLYVYSTCNSNTIACDIISNIGDFKGGGIYDGGANSVIEGKIIGNGLDYNNGTYGGGIVCAGSYALISNSIIQSNFSGGFSIAYANGVVFTVPNGRIISSDISYNSVGGITCVSPNIFISNTVVSHNGSGVYFGSAASNSTLFGSVFGNGGGICIDSASNITICANVYGNYFTAGYGGGLSMTNSTDIRLLNSAVTNNYDAGGGAVCLSGSKLVKISNCFLGGTNNSSFSGVYEAGSDSTNQTLMDNIFITNTLGSLYYDFIFGAVGITETGKLNSPVYSDGTNYTGADVASGNKVTNM